MITKGQVYVGDVGTIIELDGGVDLSSNTGLEILVKKPSGAEVTWPATLKSIDPTKAYFIVGHGDLDEAGIYKLQLKADLTTPTGTWSGLGDTCYLEVRNPFS